jgi:ferric-dicitrate binding protein FerR (iron transport regulator)
VETSSSYKEEHAKEQMAAFKNWKDEDPENRQIWLNVEGPNDNDYSEVLPDYDRYFVYTPI